MAAHLRNAEGKAQLRRQTCAGATLAALALTTLAAVAAMLCDDDRGHAGLRLEVRRARLHLRIIDRGSAQRRRARENGGADAEPDLVLGAHDNRPCGLIARSRDGRYERKLCDVQQFFFPRITPIKNWISCAPHPARS
jgi:hypothetical protein